MEDCGHRCCRIPDNAYHVHPCPPQECPNCRSALAGPPAADGDIRADVERMSRDLARTADTVIHRIAPQIPGLALGNGLEDLVSSLTAAHYLDALDDPDLYGLDQADWRTIVAARVAFTLAFPDPRRPPT